MHVFTTENLILWWCDTCLWCIQPGPGSLSSAQSASRFHVWTSTCCYFTYIGV